MSCVVLIRRPSTSPVLLLLTRPAAGCMQTSRVRGRVAVRLKEASVQALHEASEALEHVIGRKPHMGLIIRSTLAAIVRPDQPP